MEIFVDSSTFAMVMHNHKPIWEVWGEMGHYNLTDCVALKLLKKEVG